MIQMTRLILIALIVALNIGYTAVRETQPVRTATEQFILSHAKIDAAKQIESKAVAGNKVMLDLSMLKTVDVEFAHGELRDRLLQLGADLVAEAADAEIIVEVCSSGVGIDKSETMLGIPAIPIPVPAWAPSALPNCRCSSATSSTDAPAFLSPASSAPPASMCFQSAPFTAVPSETTSPSSAFPSIAAEKICRSDPIAGRLILCYI